MDYFPIFMDLNGQPCLVVGAGAVASRKISLLVRSGAAVTVVAPDAIDVIQMAAERREIRWQPRPWQVTDIDGVRLVFAATGDDQLNETIAAQCKAANVPVNVVDKTALCSFIMPSIVDRSPVIAAVSTGGSAPALARLIRARLETTIPPALGNLAKLAGRFREEVKQRFKTVIERRQFWERTFEGEVAELVFAGREEAAEQCMLNILESPAAPLQTGEVYLVGAGPGDPDLLTFKALRLMQRADVVLYDRLVTQPILDLVRRDAELIYVGKRRGDHAVRQQKINEHLVELSRQGKRVLRLKGGDPFIFGRGGEEIDTLAQHNVRFQVVPGITAASGCAAYAGIPLTHRDFAQSCVFVAGHLKDGTVDLNWKSLAQPEQTIVFYMGLVGLPVITERLIEHGMPPDTPAALVQQGTTTDQKVLTSTLARLAQEVEREKPRPPTLLIVGQVVQLQEKLGWYRTEADVRHQDLIRSEPS